MVPVELTTHQTMEEYLQYFQYKWNDWHAIAEKQIAFKWQGRFWDSPSCYIQQDSHPHYQITSNTSCDYHSPRPGQSDSQSKAITTEVKKQKTVKAPPLHRMITTNHGSLQCSGRCHFGRFNCDAKAYAADADSEDSDCSSGEEQTYHTVSNNNGSEDSGSEEDNSTINFALSESPQHRHEYQQCCEKYFTQNALFAHLQAQKTKGKTYYWTEKCSDEEKPTAFVTQQTAPGKLKIIHLKNKLKLQHGYAFRGYCYAKISIQVTEDMNSSYYTVCDDSDCLMFLINRLLLMKLYSKVELQQMNTSISIWGIGMNYHTTSQFVHIDMFIKATDETDDIIIVHMCKEFHVINDLKVNILIGTDILRTEDINLKFSTDEMIFTNHKDVTAPMWVWYKDNILHTPLSIQTN